MPADGLLNSTTLWDALSETTNVATKPKFISPELYNPATQHAAEFLKQYDRCAAANGWNYLHRLRYFPTFLTGAAHTWATKFFADPLNIDKSWVNVKDAFLLQFEWEDSKTEREYKLRMLRQAEGEGIKAYFFRVIVVLDDQLVPYTDKELQVAFESFRKFYFLIANRVMSHEELKNVVYKLDKQLADDSGSGPLLLTAGETETETPKPHKSQGARLRDSKSPLRPSRSVTGRPLCYSWCKSGHFANSCVIKKLFDRLPVCYSCGQKDTLSRTVLAF